MPQRCDTFWGGGGRDADADAGQRPGTEAAPETLIGRFDLIPTASGYRVIELNAETPFFIVESHLISGRAANEAGYADPNAGCAERLAGAIARAIGATDSHLHVAVAAHDAAAEDRATAQYLRDLIDRASAARVSYVPLASLRARRRVVRRVRKD